jgi:hypothetical protein
MKKIFTIIAALMLTVFVFAQDGNKDVTIISSGSGLTLEEAKQSALRSATEQAFGAFISSKTEVFNDEVVADQMSSVSSGNINSFEILNQDQLPDGRWSITLKSLVSIDKLTSFVQAKGIEIEIKGGLFALNIKQQLLNEQSEIAAVYELVGLLHEPLQTAFDYTIKSEDPKSIDSESKNWEIPLEVSATCNKNIDFCANYFLKTIQALSLSGDEVKTYLALNKSVFPIQVSFSGKSEVFYLRKERSAILINSFISNWEYYTRLFVVKSGVDESFGQGSGEIFDFGFPRIRKPLAPEEITEINFPTTSQVAATFRWHDKRTLNQIEEMTGYIVNPRGVISNFRNGGYQLTKVDGHRLVISLYSFNKLNWNDAKTTCDDLFLNGFSDWHLPSYDELQLVYQKLWGLGIGGFISPFWSSTEFTGQYYQGYMYFFDFQRPDQEGNACRKDGFLNVLPVRSF